jgi:hypothetical protein
MYNIIKIYNTLIMSLLQYYNEEKKTMNLPNDVNEEIGCMGCNDIKCPKNLPSSLNGLILGLYFNQTVDRLPSSLTHLTFKNISIFNQTVDKLPSSLTHLTFGFNFNQNVEKLPSSLTHLTLGNKFNQSVDKLPPSLTHLTFGEEFNQSVDNLPFSLTHLTFEYKFNKTVNNLPSSLTHLTLGCYFNQSIENLPSSITHLTLGWQFNQNINILPSSLIELFFSSMSIIKNNIPNNITNIKIYFYDNDKINDYIDNLPISIKKIKINLPEKIHFLKKIPFGCIVTDFDDNVLST